MSDKAELNIECKESVALQIAREIAVQEELYRDKPNFRKKFLDLYAECLEATHQQRDFSV